MTAVALLLLALAPSDDPPCSFDTGPRLLTCSTPPGIVLPVPEGLAPVGALSFDLADRARVDRQLLARVDDRRVTALVVLQFEGLLPGIDGRYSFGVPPEEQRAGSNYRFSPEPVRLGSHAFVHNTWAFDAAADAAKHPGFENDRTRRFLASAGLELADELVMSRFVRSVGADGRRELILFYLEPLPAGRTLEDYPDGGPPSRAYDELSAAVTERSLALFGRLEELGD